MNKFSLRYMLASFILLAGCGQSLKTASVEIESTSTTDASIINGEFCDAETQDSAVSIIAISKVGVPEYNIFDKDYASAICTGTLIAPDVVLTAAHCIHQTYLEERIEKQFSRGAQVDVYNTKFHISFFPDQRGLEEASIRAFRNSAGIDLPSDIVPATHWLMHEGYNGFENGSIGGFNIALVFLERPVYNVSPSIVITPEEWDEHVTENMSVEIAGWGLDRMSSDQNASSGLKHCATSYISLIGTYEFQIGDPNSARICNGDSGGPAYINLPNVDTPTKKRVIGVTSYSDLHCTTGGYDMRPDAYYDWIDEKMSENCDVGVRSWCDTSSILTPNLFNEDGELDPYLGLSEEELEDVLGFEEDDDDSNSSDEEDETDVEELGGCQQQSSGLTLMLTGIIGLVLSLVRRKRLRSYRQLS